MWIERDDGSHIFMVKNRGWVLIELIPSGAITVVWILNRMYRSSVMTDDIERAKVEGIQILNNVVGEFFMSVRESE